MASPSWRVTSRVIFKHSPHLLNEALLMLPLKLAGPLAVGGREAVA